MGYILIMKGLFLTILALFVASCQMRTLLVRTGSTEDSGYQDSKPKDFCKKIAARIKGLCSTPENRAKNKCEGREKFLGKLCGSPESSDYNDSKQKGFCKNAAETVSMLCYGFEKGRQKCDDLKKSLKKECGSEGGDYLTFNNNNQKYTKNEQNVRKGDKYQINNGNVGGNMGQSDYAQINTGSVGKNMIQGGNNNHQGNWGNVGGDMVQRG